MRRRDMTVGSESLGVVPPGQTSKLKSTRNAACVIGLTFFLAVVIRSAWMCDDAYISLRVVDNFVNGYGLRWNIDERVQVFTHPLWLLLISGFYFFTREAYFTTLLVSVALSAYSVSLICRAAQNSSGALFSAAAFACSCAFVDYSTSGLENPLTHALLGLFTVWFIGKSARANNLLMLSFLMSLALVNRLDMFLIFAPMLGQCFLENRSMKALATIFLGFIPLYLWEAFSLIYYGFLLPNTTYAKLPGNLDGANVGYQGLIYLLDSLYRDPVTLFVCIAGMTGAFVQGTARTRSVALGMGLYVTYIVSVGGDFMSGRFLSAVFLLGTLLVQTCIVNHNRSIGNWAIIGLIALCFSSPTSTFTSVVNREVKKDPPIEDWSMVSDERATFAPTTGIFRVGRGVEPLEHNLWAQDGVAFRDGIPPNLDPTKQLIVSVLDSGAGIKPYYAGPAFHFIDRFGICDPLLARLEPAGWAMSGHLWRQIPHGYQGHLLNKSTPIMDTGIRQYYSELETIVRGPILSWQRAVSIWKINSGQMNNLLPHVPFAKDLGSMTIEEREVWKQNVTQNQD